MANGLLLLGAGEAGVGGVIPFPALPLLFRFQTNLSTFFQSADGTTPATDVEV